MARAELIFGAFSGGILATEGEANPGLFAGDPVLMITAYDTDRVLWSQLGEAYPDDPNTRRVGQYAVEGFIQLFARDMLFTTTSVLYIEANEGAEGICVPILCIPGKDSSFTSLATIDPAAWPTPTGGDADTLYWLANHALVDYYANYSVPAELPIYYRDLFLSEQHEKLGILGIDAADGPAFRAYYSIDRYFQPERFAGAIPAFGDEARTAAVPAAPTLALFILGVSLLRLFSPGRSQ